MATQDQNRWYKGHIASWWGLSHRDLDYINEPFNDPESLQHWKQLGYTQTKFTGDMYDMRFEMPEWLDGFGAYFKQWHNIGWSVYRMGPGTVLPTHSDTYKRYIKVNNLTGPQNIWRAIVFLESWQSGHYLEIDGIPITQWACGDYVAWNNDVSHLACNMGFTDRYTLQLTGHKL